MVSDPVITSFTSRARMAEPLADEIEATLAHAIAEKGAGLLAVSGGSTPAGLYEVLSKRDLDWSKVTILLVDERWVPPGTEGSNESFVRRVLLQNKASVASFIGLWSDALTPAEGLATVQERLNGLGTIDVVVLGMGNDGHTASWFPHCDGLEAALIETHEGEGPRVAAIRAKPSAVTGKHLDRMTLTLEAIKASSFICLLLTGDDKRSTFENALTKGPIAQMPVRALLRARADLWVGWAP